MDSASDDMREIYHNYVCTLPEISQKGGSFTETVRIELPMFPQGLKYIIPWMARIRIKTARSIRIR